MRNVIVACGKSKTEHPVMAHQLYTGGYFRLALACAKLYEPLENIYIFSAKYGIVHSSDVLEPYEQTLEMPGAIKITTLYEQLAPIERDEMVFFGGMRYLNMLRRIKRDIKAPLQEIKGLGMAQQMALIRRILNGG